MSEMSLAFETDRLRVFLSQVKPWEGSDVHDVYLAFPKTIGAAVPVAHAVVSDWRTHEVTELRCVFCQVVEVSALAKGQRFGEELFLGIEKFLKVPLQGYATTDHGREFLSRLERQTDFGEEVVDPLRRELAQAIATAKEQGNTTAVELASTILEVANDRSLQPSERLRYINMCLVKLVELLTPPKGK